MESMKKILIVEDDRDINELIAYNLVKQGFEVTSVYDGTEAKETLQLEYFDIVILDIMLPGVDGFHICKSIKENPAAFKTFVVMLTARTESQDKIYGNLVGADCYITKPFSLNKLMGIIEELIMIRGGEHFVQNNNLIYSTKRKIENEEKDCALTGGGV